MSPWSGKNKYLLTLRDLKKQEDNYLAGNRTTLTMRILLFLAVVFLLPVSYVMGQDISSPAVLKQFDLIEAIRNDTLRIDSLAKYVSGMEDQYPRDAITIADHIIDESGKIHYRKGLSLGYKALGSAYKVLTDYPKALKYLLQALDLQKSLQLYRDEINTCLAISVIYDLTEDIEKQRKYIEEALAICRTNKLADKLTSVLNELAIVYKKKGQLDTAVQLYKNALENATQNDDTMGRIASLTNMAIAYKSGKRYEASLDAYNQAISLADTTNNVYVHAIISDNMAILFYEMGDLEQAETYALKALSLQNKIHEINISLDCYDLLRKIYTAQKKYPLALDYFSKWVAAKDTVLNAEKSGQIKELQTRYDTDAKDKQIKAQREQISYSRKITFFLIFTTLLILAIGLIIYANQRRTKKLNKLVTSQKQELEKLNAVKDRIFSVISHDMRTPVNSLISFTQILENGKLPAEKLTAYSASLKSSLNYTAGLLENLLNWAQTQMQGYKPVPEKFSIFHAARQAAGLLEPDAERKNVKIINNITTDTLVYADMNMTALILRNLVSNAIKFTGNGGQITISAGSENSKTLVSVCDNGIGMSPETVARFNINNQSAIDSTRGTANEKGTGLGLMLCKNFASLMNGNITVRSEAGKGSCFVLSLPSA